MKSEKFTMTFEEFDELSAAWEEDDYEELSIVPEGVSNFWIALGKRLSFVPATACHIMGKDPRFFIAEPLCMEGKCGHKTTRVR